MNHLFIHAFEIHNKLEIDFFWQVATMPSLDLRFFSVLFSVGCKYNVLNLTFVISFFARFSTSPQRKPRVAWFESYYVVKLTRTYRGADILASVGDTTFYLRHFI